MTSLLDKPLRKLLEEIQDSRRETILKIYDDYKDLFYYSAGSSNNHQAWEGGYVDHIAECLRVNDVTYEALETLRSLGFSKDSAAIALFFHDIEKPFRYGPENHDESNKWRDVFNKSALDWEGVKWLILDDLKARYGFELTDEEINALKYTHGEGDDHRKDMRVAKPLAAHVHHCDNASARIWHDKGVGLG